LIEHVIIFRADRLSPSAESDLLGWMARLRDHAGIVGFASGKNFSDRSKRFDYCLRITFQDRDALDAYQNDPAHLAFVEYREAVTDDLICVDYEWWPR